MIGRALGINLSLVGMLVLAGGGLWMQSRQADRLRAEVASHEACVDAVRERPGAEPVSKVCDLAIASAKAALDNTIACAGALGATPENGPVIQRTCPAPVRAALTERDVARRERANALGELALERAGRSAAIQRAASAAQLQAERKARAEAAVQRAPRDGSGRVVCDADCMRERWGQAVAGQ